jgi:hypothetical protein
MTRPRRANAKLIFAFEQAMRIVAGSVNVIPNPAAGPLMAIIVGFWQLCIASVTLPPLR